MIDYLTKVNDKLLLFLVATPNSYQTEKLEAEHLPQFLSRFLFPDFNYTIEGDDTLKFGTEALLKGKVVADKAAKKVYFCDATGKQLFPLSIGLVVRFDAPVDSARQMTVNENLTDFTSLMEIAKTFATRLEISGMVKDANNFYNKELNDGEQIHPFVNRRFYFEGESTLFSMAVKHRMEVLEEPKKRRICLYVPLKMKTKVHLYFHPMAQQLYRCVEADLKLLGPHFNPLLQPLLLDTPLYTLGYFADLLANALRKTNRFTYTRRFASELDDLLYENGKRMLAPIVILDDWHFASADHHDRRNATLSFMRRISLTMNWFTFLMSLDSSQVAQHDQNALKEQFEAMEMF